MISFITVGRDDDYGNRFLDRLHLSISKNIETIERLNVSYEYLVVEWSPVRDYLINNENFVDIFQKKNVINVIIKPEVGIKENLKPTIFYEYFAKNVGIRVSRYDTLVILNSDIIIPDDTMKAFIDLKIDESNDKKFYRPSIRVDVDYNLNKISTFYLTKNYDEINIKYGGGFGGDMLVINKDILIKYGEGYDETNPRHRTISQTNMDGEILQNLLLNGVALHQINNNYLHIHHNHPNGRDGECNLNGYTNKPNWGFIDYPKKNVSENLIEIG